MAVTRPLFLFLEKIGKLDDLGDGLKITRYIRCMSKGQLEKIEVICEVCKQPRTVARGTYQSAIRRNGFYRCASCSPQRTKEFWEDTDRKTKHGETMKASTAYYEAIAVRDQSGEKNGMFGKTHSLATIDKMSKSRTGKIGKNATAWKGGKHSFTIRVKGLMHTRYDWFSRVLRRDNYKCMWCGVTGMLDAHHIDPVVKIIQRITENMSFQDDDEKLEWVIKHPDIEDKSLSNGITLCRACHKKAHSNWGSHVRP